MECKKSDNTKTCTCTYSPCPRKGLCCECISYHRSNDELPGCYFSPQAERTYDRSIDFFIKNRTNK
ncbi:MAG TPA: DUF6485 family protein [Elusimicrobiales bacterium]|nr:DUF6485 family protein [Elusimicrobiales bacterium]